MRDTVINVFVYVLITCSTDHNHPHEVWSVSLFSGAFRFSEEIPNEENEINNDNLSKSSAEAKPEGSPPPIHRKVVPNSTIPSPGNHDTPITVSVLFSQNHARVKSSAMPDKIVNIVLFPSLNFQLRNMQTAFQMVSCCLCLCWWRRRRRPAGLVVLFLHRHWILTTTRTSPLSSVTPQKHMMKVASWNIHFRRLNVLFSLHIGFIDK